jgi:hypothetical protein
MWLFPRRSQPAVPEAKPRPLPPDPEALVDFPVDPGGEPLGAPPDVYDAWYAARARRRGIEFEMAVHERGSMGWFPQDGIPERSDREVRTFLAERRRRRREGPA